LFKNVNNDNSAIDIEDDSKVMSNINSQEFNSGCEEVHTVKFVVTIVAAFPAGIVFIFCSNFYESLFDVSNLLKEIDKENPNESNINKPRATEGSKFK